MESKIVHLDEDLKKLLDMGIDPKHLSVRDGRGSAKYYYIKQGVLTAYLNEAFGCLGWDMKVGEPKIERSVETRARRGGTKEVNAFEVIIKVTLRIKARTVESSDTTFEHYGIGSGDVETGQSTKDALGMAIKGAESDGFKRCAAHLGTRFGLLLTQQGTQDLIDYAQANNESRRRQMVQQERNDRDRGSSQGGQQNRSRDEEPRRQQRSDNQSSRQRDEDRSEGSRNRNDDNRSPSNSERSNNDRQQGRSNDRASDRQEDRSSGGSSERTATADKGSDAGKNQEPKREDRGQTNNDRAPSDANHSTGKDKSPPDVSDQYDLEILPMTRPEQASFAKTLLRVIGEAKPAEREGLVQKHYDVIKELESKVKKHFVNMLDKEHGIDFNSVRR